MQYSNKKFSMWKTWKTKTILYLLLVLLFSCGNKYERNGSDENFAISSTLSNKSIRALAEDSTGHIWIGTDRGLNRFDGYHYIQYFSTEDSTSLPDNKITDIFVDSKQRLWVATINGICKYTDKDDFQRINLPYDNKRCIQIFEDHRGRLFLNSAFGICIFNNSTACFDKFIDLGSNRDNIANACYFDKHDNLWIITNKEIREYSCTSNKQVFSISLKSSNRFNYHGSLLVDGKFLWIANDNGLEIFNLETRKFQNLPRNISDSPLAGDGTITCIYPFKGGLLFSSLARGIYYLNPQDRLLPPLDESEPFHFQTMCMFLDSKGNLWMGAREQGFKVIYKDYSQFNNNAQDYNFSKLNGQPVKSIAKDKKGNLWIVSKDDGIIFCNHYNKEVKEIKATALHNTELNKIFAASDGSLWIGTEQAVLKCQYDGQTLKIEKEYLTPTINDIAEDKNGDIWCVGLSDNVFVFPKGTIGFNTIKMFSYPFAMVTKITNLRDGTLLISAHNQGMKIINPDTKKITMITLDTLDYARCIKRAQYIPIDVLQDDSDNIYIGTVGNGLLKYTPLTGRLNPIDSLSCKDICAIEKDKSGNLWISTLNGLNKYDPSTKKIIQFYENDGIGGNQFIDRSSCTASDSLILFGGTHGITSFNPNKVISQRKVSVSFEYLKIHNEVITPANSKKCLSKGMLYNPAIRLKHNQNSFVIGFSAIDFGEYEKERYSYRMDGFDKYWVDANSSHEAYYANLPAGHYTFRVRATNIGNDKVIGENAINIVVKPALWNTWWAWLIYILTVILILSYIIIIRKRVKAEKAATEQAKKEKEQEQRESEIRMHFFANISHEFRTPLTMIAGPVDMLGESNAIKGNDKKLLNIVKYSINRMLRLVNQLMDVNKVEEDALQLSVRKMDIIEVIHKIVESVSFNASMKQIKIATNGLDGAFVMWLDADKLDKIMNNLLSNALKFTPDGGEIDITFTTKDGNAIISVADTGSGLPEDKKEKIFERFYQLKNQTEKTYGMGTGIGLYYSRKLAQLHHGSLIASNRKDTQGAVFVLTLPTADEVYANDPKLTEEGQENLYPVTGVDMPLESNDSSRQNNKPIILVIDDDVDAVNYLQTLLSPYYNVVYRFNADSALKILEKLEPKVILSDVTMPGMNGYEFCDKIKKDPQLCHIPVILVTARTTVDNQVEGLETGADAYVTKPFAPKLLIAVIRSQIANREKIRSLLNTSTETTESVEKALAPSDASFMDKMYKVMEENITDSDIDVNKIAGQMGMSRSKFYYKLKGLTDTTPATFFRTYKLNKAAKLIKDGQYNISEITFMTGFSSLSYFSTCFKKQFGVSPSEYK